MAEAQPDAIYHLAAQSLPTVSWQQPWETFEINFHGTLNLLDAARDAGVAGPFVFFGSSSEYADQTDPGQAIGEDYPLAANSPYAASKIAGSQLALAYQRRHDLGVMVVRPFFWIGTRNRRGDPGKVMPLGWRPQTPLTDTLTEIFQYWRERP